MGKGICSTPFPEEHSRFMNCWNHIAFRWETACSRCRIECLPRSNLFRSVVDVRLGWTYVPPIMRRTTRCWPYVLDSNDSEETYDWCPSWRSMLWYQHSCQESPFEFVLKVRPNESPLGMCSIDGILVRNVIKGTHIPMIGRKWLRDVTEMTSILSLFAQYAPSIPRFRVRSPICAAIVFPELQIQSEFSWLKKTIKRHY